MSTFIKALVEGEAAIGKTKGKASIMAAIGFAKGLQPAADAIDDLFQENKRLSQEWQTRFDAKMAEFDASKISLEGITDPTVIKNFILDKRQEYVDLARKVTAPTEKPGYSLDPVTKSESVDKMNQVNTAITNAANNLEVWSQFKKQEAQNNKTGNQSNAFRGTKDFQDLSLILDGTHSMVFDQENGKLSFVVKNPNQEVPMPVKGADGKIQYISLEEVVGHTMKATPQINDLDGGVLQARNNRAEVDELFKTTTKNMLTTKIREYDYHTIRSIALDTGYIDEGYIEEMFTRKYMIEKIQADLGFTGSEIDGIMGENTINRLKEYQKEKGLNETGQLDDATLKSFNINQETLRDYEELGFEDAVIEYYSKKYIDEAEKGFELNPKTPDEKDPSTTIKSNAIRGAMLNKKEKINVGNFQLILSQNQRGENFYLVFEKRTKDGITTWEPIGEEVNGVLVQKRYDYRDTENVLRLAKMESEREKEVNFPNPDLPDPSFEDNISQYDSPMIKFKYKGKEIAFSQLYELFYWGKTHGSKGKKGYDRPIGPGVDPYFTETYIEDWIENMLENKKSGLVKEDLTETEDDN
jgi:hypothetical protein